MRDCIKRIMEVSGLDKEKAKDMLEKLKNKAEEAVRYGDGLVDFDEAVKKIAGEELYQAKIKEMQSLREKVNKAEIQGSFTNNVLPGGDKAITADFWSTWKNLKNGKNSIATKVDTALKKYRTNLVSELQRADVHKYAKNSANDLNVAKEWNRLTGGDEKPTGDANAVKVATIFNKITNELRILQNKSGAFIGKLTGFMGGQYHNEGRIRAVPKEKWVKDVEGFADTKRMGLLSPEAVKVVLGEIYDDIISGKYAQRAINVAASVSQSRELHFKNAESFIAYNKQYGEKGLLQNTAIRVEKSARTYALMERLGVRPDEEAKRRIALISNETDRIRAQRVYDDITGKALQPVNHTIAGVGMAARALMSMVNLGMVVPSSFTDVGRLISTLQSNGVPMVESWVRGVTAPITAITNRKVRQEIAQRYAVGHRALIGSMLGSDVGMDNPTGYITKTLNGYFNLNGMNWWTDKAMQTSVVAMTTNYHARIADVKFKDLDPELLTTFNQYGIDEADWDKIRVAGEKLEDGDVYINNEKITDAKTADKYFMMINDQASRATSDPDARTRTIMSQGFRKGTIEGETLGLLTQFKSFGIASMRTGVMDMVARKQWSIMVQFMVAAYGMALVGQAVKDLARGQEPQLDYTKAAFATGIGGLAADLSVGYVMNSYGEDYGAAIAGPTFGKIFNYMTELSKEEGSWEREKYARKRSLRKFIPGQNLYFTPALEYLFINEAIDTFAPGYLSDVEKKMNKRGEPLVGPSLYRDMQ